MLYEPTETDVRNSLQVGDGTKMMLGSYLLMNTSKLQLVLASAAHIVKLEWYRED